MNIDDLVNLGAWQRNGAFGGLSKHCISATKRALQRVDLAGLEKRQIGSLSTGQFQRVLFARLLVQDTQVIILDEPFTAIDEQTTNDLLDLILQWHQEGRTVIAILHDLEQIQQYFPTTLLLAREVVYWGDSQSAMSEQHKLRARTLINYWDNLQTKSKKPMKESA